ncbi:hypothetical protein [Cohnella hashimotonis]|uniref:DUF4363 domain-containing protein n=1 Tax=Cohnella hashimotonis TaxID=2826895 RepID=A0ABT6TU02_9BACL|nr:hypothetical protein [Cohnella hashimotonis]MDI4650336.1 hypothetical protein [Cohnella hashimotonis]
MKKLSRRFQTTFVAGLITITVVVVVAGCSNGNSGGDVLPSLSPSPSAAATQFVSPSPSSETEETPLPTVAPSETASATIAPTSTPDATPVPSKNVEPNASEPAKTPSASPKPSSTATQKNGEIEQKYESEFTSIRSSCQAKVSNLTGEVTSYIAGAKSGDGEVSIADLQKKFLGKVAAAEASCDQKFNSTLAQAEQAYKDAGVEETKLAAWKSQYDNGKAQARLSAMSKILAAWQAE